MTITVQVSGLRQSMETAEPQQVSDFIALTTPSKVLVDISPSDVVAMTREGSSLVIDRVGGEPLEVLGFFANGAGQSQLYLPGEDGQLVLASMTASSGSNSLSTIFVEASDEAMRFDPDAMMATQEAAPRDDPMEVGDGEEGDDQAADEPMQVASAEMPPAQAETDPGFQIDEVFLDDDFATAEESPEMASAEAGGGWLDGINIAPDLLGFIGFSVALGASRAAHSSSHDDAENTENADEADADAAPADAEDLLLQEDGDMLVVEGDEESAEEGMAMAPDESMAPDGMSQMVGLADSLGSDDELMNAGQEIVS